MPNDLDKIRADIKRARAWAREHFPTEGPDHLLAPPKFDIEFPEPDRMMVYPRVYGTRSLGVEYRLRWMGGKVGWEGYGVLSGQPIGWLKVPEEENDD